MTLNDVTYDLFSFKETFLHFKSLLITNKSGVGVNSKPKKQRSRHGCHSQTQSFIALKQGNHTIYKEADKKSFEKSTKIWKEKKRQESSMADHNVIHMPTLSFPSHASDLELTLTSFLYSRF